MKAYDVFISYASPDRAWVTEELLPALKTLNQNVFIDDGELQARKEEFDSSGLNPGDKLEETLRGALQSARVGTLVQSPEYFASNWCRWELEIVENLVEQEQLEVLYLIISRTEKGRLDPTTAGKKRLYVDLTTARERAKNLAFALRKISPEAQNLNLTLGRRSLQDLLRAADVKEQVEALTKRHREFAAAHEKMQAFKEIHDAIQRGQDAWYTLAKMRDNLLPDGGVPSPGTAADLLDKCRDILRATEAPALENETFWWKGQLERSEKALAELLDNFSNLDVLNQALERTHGFLFLSTASADLNARLRSASREMPVDSLRVSMAPLRPLAALPWQTGPLTEWTSLTTAFDDLEKLLGTIAQLVTVHDSLQNIDSIFSAALRIEARLFDIENIWPEIEQESQRISGGQPASPQGWLRDLQRAANEVTKYLKQVPRPNTPPKQEIEFFRNRLNQSFSRADTDLLYSSSRLEKWHQKIDQVLDRLAHLS